MHAASLLVRGPWRPRFAPPRVALPLIALPLALALSGCPAPSVPVARPEPLPPVAEERALDVDPLPGSVAELEAIAADPASGERGDASLEKIAAILHAESSFAKTSLPQLRRDAFASKADPAATRALRRRFARLRGEADPARARVGAALASSLDATSFVEAAALRRHLVCPSRFAYVPAAGGEAAPTAPLPQDHPRVFWDAWEYVHPRPLDLTPPPKGKPPRFVPLTDGPSSRDEETRYRALYAACPDDAKPTEPDHADPAGAEARAAAWVAIARGHRALDAAGGPFAVPRAIEAYQLAIRAAGVANRGPAMRHARLELGEALHAHARYRAAVLELGRALVLCDDAGACTPMEREAAVALLADSLAHLDLEGPPPDAPTIERPDVIDTEPRRETVSLKLRVALERAADPALVPPALALDVLAALAQLFDELALYDDAILALEAVRRRAPTHRELPRVAQGIAREHAKAAESMRPSTAAPRWVRALDAWAELDALVGRGSRWRDANADDPLALSEAMRHANESRAEIADSLASLARSLASAATTEGPLPLADAEALLWFARARAVWGARARETSTDASAAATLATILKAELEWRTRHGGEIDASLWAEARRAGMAARELTSRPDTRRGATSLVIALADLHVRSEEKQFVLSHGKRGFSARARSLRAPLRPRAEEPLPAAIEEAVEARDALAEDAGVFAVLPLTDAVESLTAAAGLLFAHGHTAEAQRRLTRALAFACRRRPGFQAFVRAAEMARATKDTAELSRLAAMHEDPVETCATTAEEQAQGRALTR